MILEQLSIGGDRNFGYILGDEHKRLGAVIDPAYNQELIMKTVNSHGLSVKYIICTHSDHDHIGGNDIMKKRTGAPVIIHKEAGSAIGDRLVDDGDEITLGSLTLKFIYTPGHTADCICILVENKLITGDTLFVGKIGGTRSRKAAEYQYHSLHDKLMVLPDNTVVYPGHDVGVRPISTIGEEKRTNPFILQKSFEDFLYLKEHWAEYKAQHGIK